MHLIETGRGPATLVLHGSPQASSHFRPLVERLSPNRRCYLPDLPGYGHSRAHLGAELAATTKLLEDTLLGKGIGEVAIVGSSLGAYRALALAFSGRLR